MSKPTSTPTAHPVILSSSPVVNGFRVVHEDNYSARSHVTTADGSVVAGPFYCRGDACRAADRLRRGEMVP